MSCINHTPPLCVAEHILGHFSKMKALLRCLKEFVRVAADNTSKLEQNVSFFHQMKIIVAMYHWVVLQQVHSYIILNHFCMRHV